MTDSLIILACLIAPFALMWWMLKVQRRVRALPREAEREAPWVAPYTDAVTGTDGLAYGTSLDVNDELLAAARRADERSDVKNLQGQR